MSQGFLSLFDFTGVPVGSGGVRTGKSKVGADVLAVSRATLALLRARRQRERELLDAGRLAKLKIIRDDLTIRLAEARQKELQAAAATYAVLLSEL